MSPRIKQNLRERVVKAAERCLNADSAVGILDIFMGVGFLHENHYEDWKKGKPYIPVLEDWIQCGEKKWKVATEHFLAWVNDQSLEPFDVVFERTSRQGTVPLRLTQDSDASRESLYRMKFRRPGMSIAQQERVQRKANKIADLLVYVQTGRESKCSECDASLEGELLYLEEDHALCLQCADMDHLDFLPSGNATLTRRAKKFSSLSAVVLQFNRSRKRYERQGILVTSEAIEKAEESLAADSDQRKRQREKAAILRTKLDVKLVEDMTKIIRNAYPACPSDEAEQIARHTALRGSGRVGRSAAGRELSPDAINLAVRAWVRHQHTNYDELLMQGLDRLFARQQIADDLESKLREWEAT